MDKPLVGKKPHFRPAREGNNFYRVMVYLVLILIATWVWFSIQRGEVRSPFEPTPTPTRVPESYYQEAQAYFESGKLDDPVTSDAIEAYQAALQGDPNNATAWGELARIQAYSSSMLRNDAERLKRLEEALNSANTAIELAPDDSSIRAIRAFVLDWYASNPLVSPERTVDLLAEAEREALRAYNRDPENALALAYYAEILSDQQKWAQAEKYAIQAVAKEPNLMDTHRVLGTVMETVGDYNSAIQQYNEAARLAPNLTFLYVRIGINFREGIGNADRALEYFDRAAKINQQLGVNNPIPYIEIAKTYTQQGQFFAASVNAKKALEFDSTNAHTYGQLGIIFIKARNYEGAVPLLKCATLGCTAAENEMGKADVTGLQLTNLTIAYYYVEYGTVLAFLSRPKENYCPEALPVLDMVRVAYPEDPFLTAIADDSEGLCRRVAGGEVLNPTTEPLPGEGTTTPTPTAIVTPTPEP